MRVSVFEDQRGDAVAVLFHLRETVLEIDRHLRFHQHRAERALGFRRAEIELWTAVGLEHLFTGGSLRNSIAMPADRRGLAGIHRRQAGRRESTDVPPENRECGCLAHAPRLHRRTNSARRPAIDAHVHLDRLRRVRLRHGVVVTQAGIRRRRLDGNRRANSEKAGGG